MTGLSANTFTTNLRYTNNQYRLPHGRTKMDATARGDFRFSSVDGLWLNQET